jgi:hypothetical protein
MLAATPPAGELLFSALALATLRLTTFQPIGWPHVLQATIRAASITRTSLRGT